ncbi:MAG: RNA 2',3'-cyclic phosphodiesterase [Lachnospiraceae bacterium]|nr:RNA 2',3'-cyclic phosphodiesterase [Lachnospiraceae bacterium]
MRVFIGIALPDTIRRTLADVAEKLSKTIPGRYVARDNYHITMAFIGETDQDGVAGIKRAMDAAVKGQQMIELSLGHPGYFGKKDNALLHMTVDGWEQLWDLDNRLRNELQGEEIFFDKKPFKAHITLARKARIDTETLKNWPKTNDTFCVNEITLFQSIRTEGKIRYLPIGKAHFKK